MQPGVRLHRTTAGDPRLPDLITELDRFLHANDGDELHEKVAPFNHLEPDTKAVVAEFDGIAVGCGAFRSRTAETVEIKRMFVRPSARGQKLGAAILQELEDWAVELGHRRAILETAGTLKSAVRLYDEFGYSRVPNFPPYEDIAESICFAKNLGVKRDLA